MKRLLILSGKGGTGKTTVSAAFIRFSQAGAIADCDVDAPNLHLVSQLQAQPAVSDFLGGEKAYIDPAHCTQCGLCRQHCRFSAIRVTQTGYWADPYACEGCGVCCYVCPEHAVCLQTDVAGQKSLYTGSPVFSTATLKMGRGNSGKLVSEVKMAMLKHAPASALAIIDGPPGIGCPVIASISAVDLVLAVAEPSLSGISDLQRLVKTAHSFQAQLAVCVNKWDISPECTQAIRDFCRDARIPFVGVIPYDKTASQAINSGMSLADLPCPAHDALKTVYKETIKLLNL